MRKKINVKYFKVAEIHPETRMEMFSDIELPARSSSQLNDYMCVDGFREDLGLLKASSWTVSPTTTREITITDDSFYCDDVLVDNQVEIDLLANLITEEEAS